MAKLKSDVAATLNSEVIDEVKAPVKSDNPKMHFVKYVKGISLDPLIIGAMKSMYKDVVKTSYEWAEAVNKFLTKRI